MNKKLQANASYSLIHAAMWGMYAIIFAFATNFLADKGMTISQTSIILGVTAAASCLLQVVIGELVSRIRQLKLYMATLIVALILLAGLVCMMMDHVVLALGGICVVLALLQLVPGMCNSIGMDAIAKGAPATYAVARGIGSLFYALSATFIGMLVSTMGEIMIPAVSAGLGVLLVVGILWFHLCAEKDLPEEARAAAQEKKKENFLVKNPQFTLFLAGATFLCISHFLVCTYMKQIVEYIHLGETEQGIATGITAFVELPIMFGFAFLTKKFRCNTLLRFAAAAFLLKTLGLYFATNTMGLYLAQATQCIGYGLYAVASVTYAGQVMGKEDAVRAQSYLAATISLGNVVAMSLGGFMIEAWDVPGMLLAATACAGAGAVIVLVSAKHSDESQGALKAKTVKTQNEKE